MHDSNGTPMSSNTEVRIVKEAEALPSGKHIAVSQKKPIKITVMGVNHSLTKINYGQNVHQYIVKCTTSTFFTLTHHDGYIVVVGSAQPLFQLTCHIVIFCAHF